MGIQFEERELKRNVGQEYLDFCKLIPNLVIPDMSRIFASSSTLEKLEKKMKGEDDNSKKNK